MNNIFQEGT